MKQKDKICPFFKSSCLGVACAMYSERTFEEMDDCSINMIGNELANIRRLEQKTGGY